MRFWTLYGLSYLAGGWITVLLLAGLVSMTRPPRGWWRGWGVLALVVAVLLLWPLVWMGAGGL